MLLSEEYGVNSGNVDQITTNLNAAAPEVQRIFSKDQAGAEIARKLGINPTWATAIIKSVGNYGEVFERNLDKADVDIALDPVPYNGGTTSLQALWMGAPVVVKAGGHFVSRMGASFMTAAGLTDWAANDDDAYVAIAVAKGRDRKGLLQLKRTLRERLLTYPAWDVTAPVRVKPIRVRWRRPGCPPARRKTIFPQGIFGCACSTS